MIVMTNIITQLTDNQIFIFGSNRNGTHAGGAARQAHEDFGAEWGVGEGLTGQCWAFPTLDEDMQQVTIADLEASRDKLYQFVQANPELEFILTPVGTGIAGFSREVIEAIFDTLPHNIIKTDNWT